mmetsp:Transcript_36606/g.92147  ORF Transcript_36606/g.92147 Transcript_36606/m.92147 type:complete len:138 (+) Transcript_36606:97-510(+)
MSSVHSELSSAPTSDAGGHGLRAQLRHALAADDLTGALSLLGLLSAMPVTEMPLDTDDLGKVRRRLVRLARDKLGKAVREEDGSVDEALREADVVENHFPYAVGVSSSIEYAAARWHQQDATLLMELCKRGHVDHRL